MRPSVLFITGSLARGGAERQLFYLARALQESGHEVSVASLDAGEFWELELKTLNIPVYHFNSINKYARFGAVWRLAQKLQPDLIYSFHFYTNIYAAWAARLAGKRSLGSIRNDGVYEKRMTGRMSYFHYYFPHLIVGNSRHGIENASRVFPFSRRLAILPNVIDTAKFPFQFLPYKSGETLQLLFVGRIAEQKRVDRLIRWLLAVSKQLPVHLTLIGRGEPDEETLDIIRQAEIEKLLTRFGETSDVLKFMHQAHWLVLSSDYEGTPNVVLEAMSAGLPVIAHPFEGADVLLEGCGLVDDLGQFISYDLLIDNEMRNSFSHAARIRIERDYTLAAQLRKFLRIC